MSVFGTDFLCPQVWPDLGVHYDLARSKAYCHVIPGEIGEIVQLVQAGYWIGAVLISPKRISLILWAVSPSFWPHSSRQFFLERKTPVLSRSLYLFISLSFFSFFRTPADLEMTCNLTQIASCDIMENSTYPNKTKIWTICHGSTRKKTRKFTS